MMDRTGKKSETPGNRIYIDNIPVEQALSTYLGELSLEVRTEMIPVSEALFRTTRDAVFANLSSPHYHSAAMDGIAVQAVFTYGASERVPRILRENEDFLYVNTGNPIPPDKNAVIMIEDVIDLGDGTVHILKPAHPWQHIRHIGEDIIKGEMILPSDHTIRPLDMGALLNGGIQELKVIAKPKVGILPSGDELVLDNQNPGKGRIIESNSKVFEGKILEAGGIPCIYPPVSDNPAAIKEALQKAVAENDLVILNAGSSAGSKDFSVQAIGELGRVIVHGVAMKPGKPTILGKIGGKGVIGIPGYPVSAYIVFVTFVQPLLSKMTGQTVTEQRVEAFLSQRIVSSLKHLEHVRVTLGEVRGRFTATPLHRGAGATMSLVRADGIIRVPRFSEGLEAGEKFHVLLQKPLEIIRQKLVLIGSHDPLIDILADGLPLSSGHVGSMGGILAMKRGECHLSPIHLLDERTGEYNSTFVQRYFPDQPMALIRVVQRHQGLMVAPGNPKSVKGIPDLLNPDLMYVNRQRGAGTRQLLDFQLKKAGLDAEGIQGYDRELTTHMAVALAVLNGSADAGLGIESAANAMGLDFIPLWYESYDFLLHQEDLKDTRITALMALLSSEKFQSQIMSIGGYGTEESGTVLMIGASYDR